MLHYPLADLGGMKHKKLQGDNVFTVILQLQFSQFQTLLAYNQHAEGL